MSEWWILMFFFYTLWCTIQLFYIEFLVFTSILKFRHQRQIFLSWIELDWTELYWTKHLTNPGLHPSKNFNIELFTLLGKYCIVSEFWGNLASNYHTIRRKCYIVSEFEETYFRYTQIIKICSSHCLLKKNNVYINQYIS